MQTSKENGVPRSIHLNQLVPGLSHPSYLAVLQFPRFHSEWQRVEIREGARRYKEADLIPT